MRHWDWVARLHTAIEDVAKKPFVYGTFDCALFSAHCIDAIVDGSNWAEHLRREYSDKASAVRLLDAEGGLEAAVTERLGTPVRPLQAMRGDVVLMSAEIGTEGPALGICVGERVACPSASRVVYHSLAKAIKAWPIGRDPVTGSMRLARQDQSERKDDARD